MAVTYSITAGNADGLFTVVDGKIVAAMDLTGRAGTYQLTLEAIQETTVTVTVEQVIVDETGRVSQMTTILGGRAAPVPQEYYDAVAVQANDVNLHPHMGPFTHVAIKNGDWSDPTTWDTGTVPGDLAIVNIGSFHCRYDVFSDTKIFGIHVSGTGTWEWAADRDLRLRIRTMMNHGTEIGGTPTDPIGFSPTPGKSRIEVIFHQMGVEPGVTVELGWNTMGPVRYNARFKQHALESMAISLPVGATSAVLVNAQNANWRVGDELVIPGTGYVARSSTDPWYKGPTQYFQHFNEGQVGDQQQIAQGTFHTNSQDERVKVVAFNAATGELTWDTPLQYAHTGFVRTLARGQTVSDYPIITNLSQPIQFRGAGKRDLAVDPAADLAVLQKRAHSMWMHSDDIDMRGVRFTDMGRTDIDPSMVIPPSTGGALPLMTFGQAAGPAYPTKADWQAGTNTITNPKNVQGRYPIHFHWNGPFAGRKAIVARNIVVDSSADEPPTPGWGFTQHACYLLAENVIVYRTRGAGMVTELGNEIGQWINCVVMHTIGDGFDVVLEGRSEKWRGHNGHAGIAYECQARNVMMSGCLATSSRRGYHWQIQINSYADRVPQDVSIRFRDPVVQGGDTSDNGPILPEQHDTYGRAQPQISPGVRNRSWACSHHMSVIHRGPNRQDSLPMVWHEAHALNCGEAAQFGPYTNSYYVYDSVFISKGAGTAVQFQTVAWRFVFANCHFENWAIEISDTALVTNYEGFYADLTRSGGTIRFVNYDFTYTAPIADQPWYNLMGDTIINATDPNRAIMRQGRVLTAADLPQPYPLAPYGLKLDSSYPVVAPGDTPYYVDQGGPYVFNGNPGVNQRYQFIMKGVIRDSYGDRRFGDFMTSETWPNGAALGSIKLGRHIGKMTGAQAIIRNGCFNDNGTWKTRLSFLDADRFTGEFFRFHVDVTLTNFDPAFLAANQIDPIQTVYETVFPPESIGLPKPYAVDVTPPVITSAATISIIENATLSMRLRANDGQVKWSIVGGADAAKFEIFSNFYLRLAGNAVKSYSAPDDANADRVYEVTVRATKPQGANADLAMSLPLVASSFTDNFNRANEPLDVSPNWERVSGIANQINISGNAVATTATSTANQTLYLLRHAELGMPAADYFAQVVWNSTATTSGWLVARATDANNFLGCQLIGTTLQLYKRLAGTFTVLSGLTLVANDVIRMECAGNVLRWYRNGTLAYTYTIVDSVHLSGRAGLMSRSGAANPAFDDFTVGAL